MLYITFTFYTLQLREMMYGSKIDIKEEKRRLNVPGHMDAKDMKVNGLTLTSSEDATNVS